MNSGEDDTSDSESEISCDTGEELAVIGGEGIKGEDSFGWTTCG